MNTTNPGTLYLIPVPLGDTPKEQVIPEGNNELVKTLKIFFVEELRTARRFLKKIQYPFPFEEVLFFELNEHTGISSQLLTEYLKPILEGNHAGIISEAGCPAIADPGAELVKEAQKRNIRVTPLTGPSSILLALMASGMNGQNFTFHGYLPKDQSGRRKKIQEMEEISFRKNQTQICIETPYRNQHLLEDFLNSCQAETLLCIASDITLPAESIRSKSIASWKKNVPDLNKKPTVFLLLKR